MASLWNPRVAQSLAAGEAVIRECSAREAQTWCNFIVLEPTNYPADLSMSAGLLRPERPPGRPPGELSAVPRWTTSNRSSYYVRLSGPERELRLKQFLYDYAPVAFDHPCLWRSPQVEPFPVGDAIGWLGVDFRRRRAATVTFERTTVELAVTRGRFEAAELISILRSLRPAAPVVCEKLRSTPFFRLTYQNRHDEAVPLVPTGYWRYERQADWPIRILDAREIPTALPHFKPVLPEPYELHLEGAMVFGSPDEPHEIDFVFERKSSPRHSARLLVCQAGTQNGIPFPPQLDDRQPCFHRMLEVNERLVYHAYADSRYGKHEMVWQQDAFNLMLQMKPTSETNFEWLETFLQQTILG